MGQNQSPYQVQALGGASLREGGLSIHGRAVGWPDSQVHSLQLVLLEKDLSIGVPWPLKYVPGAIQIHFSIQVHHLFSWAISGLLVFVLVL